MTSKDRIKNLIRISDSTEGVSRFRIFDKRKRMTPQEYAARKQARADAEAYMKQNYQGNCYTNTIPTIGNIDIYVFAEGISETTTDKSVFASSSWQSHFKAIYQLDTVLTQGSYVGKEPNRKPQTSKGFDFVHRFTHSITIDGAVKVVTVVVKENTDPNKKPHTYYTQHVQDSSECLFEFVSMEVQ